MVYQELSILPHLTVAENIVGTNKKVLRNGLYDWDKAIEIAQDALNVLGEACLSIDPLEKVSNLRVDQMQMVEIARAVSFGAKIILLDEPTSSLNIHETESLFRIVNALKQTGISFLFVSHRMNEVRQISDRVTVFRDGKLVLDGKLMSEITDQEVVNHMLGRKLDIVTKGNADKIHEIENNPVRLKIKFTDNDKEIVVRQGEIVGISGLAGSGRSALLRNIIGDIEWKDIEIIYDGEKYDPGNPRKSIKNDIAYIGEDRKDSGLFLDLSIGETVLMPNRVYRSTKLVKEGKERKLVASIIDQLKVKMASIDHTPSSLSGGNQQKLLFAKWYVNDPRVFLLDEPTRGVDINTKQEIYKLIEELAERGAAVLVVSSEVREMVLLCHKIVVLRDGLPAVTLMEDDINEEKIMSVITAAEHVTEAGGTA